jgi:hypothetical protein
MVLFAWFDLTFDSSIAATVAILRVRDAFLMYSSPYRYLEGLQVKDISVIRKSSCVGEYCQGRRRENQLCIGTVDLT